MMRICPSLTPLANRNVHKGCVLRVSRLDPQSRKSRLNARRGPSPLRWTPHL